MLEALAPSSKSPLWSTQHIFDKPEMVFEAHLAFLRAGAQIILTSTYQASSETFKRAGYSDVEAKDAIHQSVRLANDARTSFTDGHGNKDAIIKVALSLGPFGAILSPPQEFNGYYPPPYGPIGFSETERVYNTFDLDDTEAEQRSIEALAQCHLDRLLVFARDPGTWAMIDIIAFETIPLVREVTAIRRAMASLLTTIAGEGRSLTPKPWWISFVLPNGTCPQTRSPSGVNMLLCDLVDAALLGTPRGVGLDVNTAPIPTGIGINCTAPNLIPGLLQEISTAVKICLRSVHPPPWLVLYPNGGDIYDIVTRSWVATIGDEKNSWALDLKGLVDTILSNHYVDVWSGLVVGGCC